MTARGPRLEAIAVGSSADALTGSGDRLGKPFTGARIKAHGDGFEPWAGRPHRAAHATPLAKTGRAVSPFAPRKVRALAPGLAPRAREGRSFRGAKGDTGPRLGRGLR